MSKKRTLTMDDFVQVKKAKKELKELKERKIDEASKKAVLDLRKQCCADKNVGWQANDKITTSLLYETHPNDKLSVVQILADYKGVDIKSLQESHHKLQLQPPQVVNLKGHREEPWFYDIYIGRAMTQGGWTLNHDSIFANPVRTKYKNKEGKTLARTEVLDLYLIHLKRNPQLLDKLHLLAGKIIGCWCCPLGCHGDVLIRVFRELYVA